MASFYKQAPGNLFSTIICANCSLPGHTSKHCSQPITSYGVLLFRCKGGWNQATILQSDRAAQTGLEGLEPRLEYLMIQRKDSISFIELIRGKYKLSEYDYIRQIVSGTTRGEREKLMTKTFDELWENVWGPSKEGNHSYRHEKEQGRQKLDALRAGTPSLETLIKEAAAPQETPEWGFPKGRKNLHESEYACAMRETWEETNIAEKDIFPIRNMEPIAERFVGSNGVSYVHKYFIAYAPEGVGEEGIEVASRTNEHIQREVGDIRWFSLKDALTHIRVENPEKRDLLLRVNAIVTSYCPLQLGAKCRE